MASRPQRFDTIDLKPKKHHGFSVVLFVLGSLFPPLAVAARFGFGSDFGLNLVLTLCGYFPGHIHNFYIQNIRNNKNHKRTPKWAVRYGLIDDTALKRRAKRSQWATRYDERLPQSAHEGQEYAEDQVPDRQPTADSARTRNQLWNANDEGFYGQPAASGSTATSTTESHDGRWHYPANFDDADPPTPVAKTSSRFGKKKEKKDRWARTEDAHNAPSKPKRKKRSKSSPAEAWTDDNPSRRGSVNQPEDAVGGLYGPPRTTTEPRANGDEGLDHQF